MGGRRNGRCGGDAPPSGWSILTFGNENNGWAPYGKRLQVGLLLSPLGLVGLEVSGERYALLHPGREEYRMSALGSISFGDSDSALQGMSAVRWVLRQVLSSSVSAPGEGLPLVLDSASLSIVGAGEWTATTHGSSGRRGWRKLHLGVDQSGVILIHTLTEATGDDATTALDLLNSVDDPIVNINANAAYDTVAVYETARARGTTVIVPRARTATVSGHGPRSAIRRLVDATTTADPRYTPSTTRREARTLESQARFVRWQQAYRALKQRRPHMFDVWYAHQIAKQAVAAGCHASTIRKHMTGRPGTVIRRG